MFIVSAFVSVSQLMRGILKIVRWIKFLVSIKVSGFFFLTAVNFY